MDRLSLLDSMTKPGFEDRFRKFHTFAEFRQALKTDEQVQELLGYVEADRGFSDAVMQFFQTKFRNRLLDHPHAQDLLLATLLYVLAAVNYLDIERWALRAMDDPHLQWAGDMGREIVLKEGS